MVIKSSFQKRRFLVFVLLGSLTVLNMLIGVLCEVVSAVAASEREEMVVAFVTTRIKHMFEYEWRAGVVPCLATMLTDTSQHIICTRRISNNL